MLNVSVPPQVTLLATSSEVKLVLLMTARKFPASVMRLLMVSGTVNAVTSSVAILLTPSCAFLKVALPSNASVMLLAIKFPVALFAPAICRMPPPLHNKFPLPEIGF